MPLLLAGLSTSHACTKVESVLSIVASLLQWKGLLLAKLLWVV